MYDRQNTLSYCEGKECHSNKGPLRSVFFLAEPVPLLPSFVSLFIVLIMFSEECSWYVGGMEREKAEQFLIDVSNRRGGSTHKVCTCYDLLSCRMGNRESSWSGRE